MTRAMSGFGSREVEMTLKKSAAAGALAGAANGFFGAGGGMILVPLFIRWIKLDDKEAYASSVAVMMSLSVVSAAVYFCRQGISVPDALPYLIGGFLGGVLGGSVFKKVPTRILHVVFGVLLIYGGVRCFL